MLYCYRDEGTPGCPGHRHRPTVGQFGPCPAQTPGKRKEIQNVKPFEMKYFIIIIKIKVWPLIRPQM